MATYQELLAHYGYEKLVELGIDLYGGCFNYRFMRGSTTRLSTHSWAISVDHDPDRNLLHERANTARFARPEYKPMMQIWYNNGFENQGVELGFDYMHFQTAI